MLISKTKDRDAGENDEDVLREGFPAEHEHQDNVEPFQSFLGLDLKYVLFEVRMKTRKMSKLLPYHDAMSPRALQWAGSWAEAIELVQRLLNNCGKHTQIMRVG